MSATSKRLSSKVRKNVNNALSMLVRVKMRKRRIRSVISKSSSCRKKHQSGKSIVRTEMIIAKKKVS